MTEIATKAHLILYVADQQGSTAFYSDVLNAAPSLDVPGMSEFSLNNGAVLGLMPISGAAKLLKLEIGETDVPRAEVYVVVDSAAEFHNRALQAGARELSPLAPRDWGHTAAYSMDPDNYVLAFAEIT